MMTFNTKRFLYRTYLALPFTKYFFLAIRFFHVPLYRYRRWLRFKGTFTINHRGCPLKMVSYGNTIENELFWLGLRGWEPTSIRVWEKLASRSMVIMDVGANTGLYSLIAFRANPTASIFAFEPLPLIYKRLQRNLRLNETKVNTINIALSNEEGETVIFASETISGTFDQASLSSSKYAERGRLEFKIKTRKLSDVINELNIDTVDLMKIDVETFEPEVLKGMEQYLRLMKPTMLIEILNAQVGEQIAALVSGMDYLCYKILESGEITSVETLSQAKPGGNFLFLNDEKHGALIPEILKHL